MVKACVGTVELSYRTGRGGATLHEGERQGHELTRASPMRLLTFAGNTHALQTLIIARYNGVEIAVPPFEMGVDNKTADFKAMSPMGKVPVLVTDNGPICEAAAIARYIARMRPNENMYGNNFYEAGLVDQWIEFAKNELDLPIGMWIYPILGFIPSNVTNTEKAKDDLRNALKVLDAYLLSHTYLAGENITAADVVVSCSLLNAFKLVFDKEFMAAFPSIQRWFTTCIGQPEFTDVLGPTSLLCNESGSSAVAPTKAVGEATKVPEKSNPDKPKQERKPSKEKKEKAPKKDESKEEKKDDKGAADGEKEANKALDKLKVKIVKEGGKKGVEIEGASDMGGLDFFCTTMELPEGNLEFLVMAMDAMNADPDPEAEDRKGCSGHVGKMIFSAGVDQLAIVAYVPDGRHNKSASKVDLKAWLEDVCEAIGGEIIAQPAAANSPRGGNIATAVVKSNPGGGKFAIKDKDTAMAAAFAYLRAHGAFPEDDGDDSDEMVFGDDDNLDDYD